MAEFNASSESISTVEQKIIDISCICIDHFASKWKFMLL